MTMQKILQAGWSKFQMADEVIQILEEGSSVNLGIGMPTLIAERITPAKRISIHSENGVLGVSGRPTRDSVSATLINAGKETISIAPGASFFDSATSFGMIRGGHIDYCILGAMQVDVEGNLANWMIPGKKVTGMGGAMDLVHGAKQIIVMLSHYSKDGECKLVHRCNLPLTGLKVVHRVVSELGIFGVTGTRFRIEKLSDGVGLDDLGIDRQLLEPQGG
jgi:3-oxoacid CoA-transferase subunit B